MIGVNVTFQYEDSFDRARVIGVADNARATFEGMPGLRFKFFALDESARRANNFYVWDSKEAALEFFSDELRQRVTDLYGVRRRSSTLKSRRSSITLAPRTPNRRPWRSRRQRPGSRRRTDPPATANAEAGGACRVVRASRSCR